ncbi:DUF6421 family protein [Mobilicoccus massiliensis]|uniref:DUF6421 family protein n=1 Tax=Mobilicoccus massiliensis TaxID=1522310 RepID=UPI00059064B5|nr:DUF6421 family protein [Mobilicoccus massiliensis]
MSVFPRVVVDEAHNEAWSLDPQTAARINPAQPADASYAEAAEALRHRGFEVTAHTAGELDGAVLDEADVLVVAHPADAASERTSGSGSPTFSPDELDAIEAYVRGGGGLVVLGECQQGSYGSNLLELLARFGLTIRNNTAHDGTHRFNGVSAWVRGELETEQEGRRRGGVLAGIDEVCFYRAGTLAVEDPAKAGDVRILARTSEVADPAGEPLALTARPGAGRLVLLGDSDLFGDDSIDDLDHRAWWVNLVTWAAGAGRGHSEADLAAAWLAVDPRWLELKAAVEEIRPMQSKDGSIDGETHDLAAAGALVDRICAGIEALAPEFPHDADYLTQCVADFRRWQSEGFGVPDFFDSLELFHPDRDREDGLAHLVVFPMYTQNGNLDRNVEAVLIRVYWPEWLAEVEQTYTNPAFLSIDFIDFTPGYDTDSAVLFPETVATREVAKFTWGAIFSDREAARFRRVTSAAADLLSLDLPPDAERLLVSQEYCQGMFAMWDMIHDRTHMRGDLPFDPFMIKQRMPYWMYSLEELRCDLNTFVQAVKLEKEGQPFAKGVQYGVIFDRIFRFSITGGRVRNYDGLGGQLLFAWLHKHDALRWTDNRLSFDWQQVPEQVCALADAVNALYRDGIDRSKVAQWIASYDFVSQYVVPHPRSTWAKGAEALPLEGKPKELVDLVLPDEFPLNMFFEALDRKLGPVIASTKGITAADVQVAPAETTNEVTV